MLPHGGEEAAHRRGQCLEHGQEGAQLSAHTRGGTLACAWVEGDVAWR
jgi:hypothetical protein